MRRAAPAALALALLVALVSVLLPDERSSHRERTVSAPARSRAPASRSPFEGAAASRSAAARHPASASRAAASARATSPPELGAACGAPRPERSISGSVLDPLLRP